MVICPVYRSPFDSTGGTSIVVNVDMRSIHHQCEFGSCKLIGGVEVLRLHACWSLVPCCEQKVWASRPDSTMTYHRYPILSYVV